jgi:hypothetical protein
MYASRKKHVQKRQEQNKIVQNPKKKTVKSKESTKNKNKTLEMNGRQGIHRLAPWNKQTTRRTATQIQEKNSGKKTKNWNLINTCHSNSIFSIFHPTRGPS